MKDGEPADLSLVMPNLHQDDDLFMYACLSTSGPALEFMEIQNFGCEFSFVQLHTPLLYFPRSSHPSCTFPALHIDMIQGGNLIRGFGQFFLRCAGRAFLLLFYYNRRTILGDVAIRYSGAMDGRRSRSGNMDGWMEWSKQASK